MIKLYYRITNDELKFYEILQLNLRSKHQFNQFKVDFYHHYYYLNAFLYIALMIFNQDKCTLYLIFETQVKQTHKINS